MKTLSKLRKTNYLGKKCLLVAGAFSLASASVSEAVVLISIDASDMSAVVFTAAGDVALLNDSTSHTGEGITMRTLFQSDIVLSTTLFTGTFKVDGSAEAYTHFTNSEVGLNAVDLNISRASPDTFVQNFVTNGAPFSGTMTLDLTGATILAGSSGNIIAGYGHDPSSFGSASNAVIGEWQVVPEPSSALMLALSGLIVMRRKR